MDKTHTIKSLNYGPDGLIPAIIQDDGSGEILMMAYMNADSLKMTLEKGFTHFWSRSRKKFWMKGETSGHVQKVKQIFYDCDRDTLLIKVNQKGPGACHTGSRSCFFTTIEGEEQSGKVFSANEAYKKQPVLERLAAVIHDRRCNPKTDSYVSGLLEKGKDTVLKKVGEEATEAVVAAAQGNRESFIQELADLWFHTLILMEQEGVAITEVYDELENRFR